MLPFIKTDPDLVDEGPWSYRAGVGEVRSGYGYWAAQAHLADCNESQPQGNQDSRGSKRKLEHESNVPDTKRQALRREAFDHNDLVKKEESDDELFFVSQPKTPSLIPSTGTASSHSNTAVKKEESDDKLFFVSQPRTPSLTPNTGTTTSPSSPLCPSSLRQSTSETIPIESTPPTPCPNPTPKPPHWSPTEDARGCTCPIDLHCGVKADHLIDCRPLVPEGEQWWPSKPGLTREDLPCNKEGETVATAEELAALVTLCNEIATEQPGTARAHMLRNVVPRLEALTALLNSSSVHLHDLESSQVLPRLQNLLAPTNRAILDGNRIPARVREDMLMLVRRWGVGDFCALPHRGLLRRVRQRQPDQEEDQDHNDSRHSASTGPFLWALDRSWPFKRSAAVFGHGHCVNGQTWPNRMAMARDGAHGMWMAGIHGSERRGAYAVMMGLHLPRGIKYAHVDFGQTIYYIGTALKRDEGDERPTNVMDTSGDEEEAEELAAADPGREPTSATQAMMKSHRTQLPVRVFRSYKVSPLVPGGPKGCYRYDGLYRVVDYECLKAIRQIYQFKMTRLSDEEARVKWGAGQGPLRGWEKESGRKRGRK